MQSTYVKFGLWPWTKVDETAAVNAKVAGGAKRMMMEGLKVVGKALGDAEHLNKRLGLALRIKNRSVGGSGGDKVPRDESKNIGTSIEGQTLDTYYIPAAPSLTAV